MRKLSLEIFREPKIKMRFLSVKFKKYLLQKYCKRTERNYKYKKFVAKKLTTKKII